MKEIWKQVEGYEGIYEVSNTGYIKSLSRCVKHSKGGRKIIIERILKSNKNNCGYKVVGLYKDGKFKKTTLQRFVAEAFIPNPENKPEINHKNGIKTDNRAENLEWVTSSENQKHAYENGLQNNDSIKKKVAQIKDGNTLKIWESQLEACIELKIHATSISQCCLGKRKTAGGFQWKFA